MIADKGIGKRGFCTGHEDTSQARPGEHGARVGSEVRGEEAAAVFVEQEELPIRHEGSGL